MSEDHFVDANVMMKEAAVSVASLGVSGSVVSCGDVMICQLLLVARCAGL